MSVEQSIYSILSGNAGVTAIAGTRIRPIMVGNADGFPAVTYQRVTTSQRYSYGGNSNKATGRWQLNCLAATYAQAKNLAEAVKAAIDTYSGTSGDFRLAHVFVDDMQDLPHDPEDGSEKPIYGVRLDIRTVFTDNG